MLRFLICLLLCLGSGSGWALAKPYKTTDSCHACSELTSFSQKLVSSMQDVDVRNNVTKWCVDYGFGSTSEVCQYIITNLESVFQRINSDRFCNGIKACTSITEDDSTLASVSSLSPRHPDKDIQCDFCLNSMSHIKEIISSPPTVNEVKVILESGCKTVKQLRNECTRLLDENLDEIFKFIREKFDSRKFCEETKCCPQPGQLSKEELHLSISETINIYPPFIGEGLSKQEKVEAGPECILCHLFMHIIARELEKNSTVTEIEAYLEGTCSKLFKDEKMIECQNKVERYTQRMIKLFSRGVGPEVICFAFGCTASMDLSFFEKLNSNPIACNFCQQVLTQVYSILSNNRSQEAIEKALEAACNALPDNQKSSCKVMIKAYEDELAKVISESQNPKEACQKLELCDTKTTSIDELASLDKPDTECILCKRIFEFLFDYLQENKTEEKIQEALDKACDIFPSASRIRCEGFVRQYTAQIIDIVLRTTDPSQACEVMNFCKPRPSNPEVEELEYAPMIPMLQKATPITEANGEICEVCKSIFITVHDIIVANGSSVVKALEKACIPCLAREKCEKVLEKYFTQILNMIESQTDPDVACASLKLCPGNAVFVGEREEANLGSSTTREQEEGNNEIESEGGNRFKICFECQAITRLVQKELYDYKTEEEISKFVRKELCSRLVDRSMKEACQSFIAEYGDSIIQMIALKVFDPDSICEHELKLCPQPGPHATQSNPQNDFAFTQADQEETCSLCVDLVSKIGSVDSFPIDSADVLASSLCSHENDAKKNKCKDLYDTFGRHFVHMVGYDTPSKICSAVDLCYSTNGHLLGGKKCSFGPTYWCHTQAHAEACKATDFCKVKIWKAVE